MSLPLLLSLPPSSPLLPPLLLSLPLPPLPPLLLSLPLPPLSLLRWSSSPPPTSAVPIDVVGGATLAPSLLEGAPSLASPAPDSWGAAGGAASAARAGGPAGPGAAVVPRLKPGPPSTGSLSALPPPWFDAPSPTSSSSVANSSSSSAMGGSDWGRAAGAAGTDCQVKVRVVISWRFSFKMRTQSRLVLIPRPR
ncbi:unnamed protein product [Ectocarpus sp. CCAP 1310/34]|nr:unnamed protein product [Ectocarpus sp. CCAP 1310/34]